MYYMKPLKSPTHIHLFDEKFYGFETVFCIMILGFFPYFNAYYVERKFCHRYTRALSPVWNRPPYTRIICEKISPQIYIIIAVRLESVGDWLSVGILVFVCIAFYICGYRLKKIVFVDWLMSKFGCKSVIKSHKFIVKMWLCICNCMCICVCI